MRTFKKYQINFSEIFPKGFAPFFHDGVLLAYNQHTGELMRETKFGDIRLIRAGTDNGYSVIDIKGKKVLIHRLIAQYFLNAGNRISEDLVVDHIEHANGSTYQDRLENLRITTRRGNGQNLKNGASTLSGVSFHKQSSKWQARIKIDGKEKYLGLFNTELDAGMMYRCALKLRGFDTTIPDEKILAYKENHGFIE